MVVSADHTYSTCQKAPIQLNTYARNRIASIRVRFAFISFGVNESTLRRC
eukprot:m.117788 g.117788  ORF g.117788 m.117788 type:complete len:50 (-) comp14260_c0_seq2:212-361(-)